MLQKEYQNILDLINTQKFCVFCHFPMKCKISNFILVKDNNFSKTKLLNNKLSMRFKFLNGDTNIKSHVIIDILNNNIYFKVKGSTTPAVDQFAAKSFFQDFYPSIGIHCSNKKCLFSYSINSNIFLIKDIENGYSILPFPVTESFITENHVIVNDPNLQQTKIYKTVIIEGMVNDEVTIPMMNLDSMNEKQILSRIKNVVLFS